MQSIVETIKKLLEAIPATWEIITLLLGFVLAARGAVKAFAEIPDYLTDWWDQFHERAFRVKTTTMKVIISENQTQVVKLRTVRAHEKLDRLVLDPVPVFGPGPANKDQRAPLNASQYSVPGRSSVTPWENRNRFQISLLPDEVLAAHEDHPVVLSFIMDQAIDVLFDTTFFEAVQPVGRDLLIMEIYFPSSRKLKPGPAKCGQVFPVDANGTLGAELADSKAHVAAYRSVDFHDGRGEIDFIRAIIHEPPQDCNIRLQWEWKRKP